MENLSKDCRRESADSNCSDTNVDVNLSEFDLDDGLGDFDGCQCSDELPVKIEVEVVGESTARRAAPERKKKFNFKFMFLVMFIAIPIFALTFFGVKGNVFGRDKSNSWYNSNNSNVSMSQETFNVCLFYGREYSEVFHNIDMLMVPCFCINVSEGLRLPTFSDEVNEYFLGWYYNDGKKVDGNVVYGNSNETIAIVAHWSEELLTKYGK